MKLKVSTYKLKHTEIKPRSISEAFEFMFDSCIPSPYWAYPFFDVGERIEEISQKYIEHEMKK